MDKINILIVEDNAAESEALADTLRANGYHIAGIATTHAEALSLFYREKTDVAIIDIFLGGNPEGISFAEAISSIPGSAKPFVFLTHSVSREIFDRARLTHPFSYLIKPFNELEIGYAVEMAVEKFYAQPGTFYNSNRDTVVGNEMLFIKKKDALKKVLLSDIVYIGVEERYCNIITETEKFVILISLTRILELLDARVFIRTHRNYLVNSSKIIQIVMADNLVMLKGNHQVPLSGKYREFINRFPILK
jgi:two-component system, LytTR family, response regulator